MLFCVRLRLWIMSFRGFWNLLLQGAVEMWEYVDEGAFAGGRRNVEKCQRTSYIELRRLAGRHYWRLSPKLRALYFVSIYEVRWHFSTFRLLCWVCRGVFFKKRFLELRGEWIMKDNNKKFAMVAIVVILIVAIVGVGVWYFYES